MYIKSIYQYIETEIKISTLKSYYIIVCILIYIKKKFLVNLLENYGRFYCFVIVLQTI